MINTRYILFCRSAMSMAERKIENKQIIISYSASLFIATKFPEGQVISILLATRGQFERVVPFWSPTEYSSAKKTGKNTHCSHHLAVEKYSQFSCIAIKKVVVAYAC